MKNVTNCMNLDNCAWCNTTSVCTTYDPCTNQTILGDECPVWMASPVQVNCKQYQQYQYQILLVLALAPCVICCCLGFFYFITWIDKDNRRNYISYRSYEMGPCAFCITAFLFGAYFIYVVIDIILSFFDIILASELLAWPIAIFFCCLIVACIIGLPIGCGVLIWKICRRKCSKNADYYVQYS